MNNHPVCSPSTRTNLLLMTMILDSNTVAESDLSLKSRSFLHRVNERVRKIQDQTSNDATDIESFFKRCTEKQRQTFCDMGNVHVFDIGSMCVHGRFTQTLCIPSKIQKISL